MCIWFGKTDCFRYFKQQKMLTQGISLKLMSEMLRWEGQSIRNSCLRNQEMQILLGVTSEQMNADECRWVQMSADEVPAASSWGIWRGCPEGTRKHHISYLPKPMCLVTTAAGASLASISLSNSLHKCLLMENFKLKIFSQDSFLVPTVWH